jgi:transposase
MKYCDVHGMESQMKAYSIDLRERVLADFQGGMKFADLGRKYSVSAEWVRQFIRRYQATGEIAARPPLTKKVPFYRRHETALRTALAEQPDLTLEALRTKLKLDVSIGTLHQALVNLKLSFKKIASGGRAAPARRRSPAAGIPNVPKAWHRSEPLRIPRRNLGQNQYDAALWPVPGRRTSHRIRAARPLEDHDLPQRVAGRWTLCPASRGWCHQRGNLPRLGHATPGAHLAFGRHRRDG